MSERRRVTQLGGRNHSVRLTPFPTASRKVLQSCPELRRAHWISVDAHVLCEETRKGFQKSSFEVAVNVGKCSNRQGKSCDEAHRRLRIAVYQSCHIVQLGLSKKQHIAASSKQSSDAARQVGDHRHRFARRERSSRQTKKSSRRQLCFAQFLPQLLDSRGQ